MNRRHVVSCGLACALLALAACDSGREAPGRVGVRIANAAPGFVELNFQREQASRANPPITLAFKSVQEVDYDADTYDFFVADATGASGPWTFAPTLETGRAYTFVLAEVADSVQPVVLEYAAAPAADAQIMGLHAATGLPAMDLYLERPGVGIAGATPRGTFGALQQIAPRTLPSGDYELTLTAAGDPANVLLTTATIALPAGITSTFVVVPEGGQSAQPLSVLLIQSTLAVLYDRNATTELRVINGATDRAPRDFAVDNQFAPPLFSAAAFGEPTPYATVPVNSALPIAVTPVGNSGVLELNQTHAAAVEQRATILFTGPAGTLTAVAGADDGRRLSALAKVRFMNAATQFTGIDFVLTTPGGDPAATIPLLALTAPGIASYTPITPDEYDLYLHQMSTTTVLSGPTRISVAARGVYGVLAVDGPDTATASVLLLDDFP